MRGTRTRKPRQIGRAGFTMLAAVTTRLALDWARAHPPGGSTRWERINHRGEPISLLEGPVTAATAALGVAVIPGLSPRLRAGAVIAVLGAGSFGLVDDLAERGAAKGLKGHVSALRRGEVTTGAAKIAGIGGTGLLAAFLVTPDSNRRSGVVRAVEVSAAGALIAATANLVNLLDLRPGRALKSVLLLAPAAGSPSSVGELTCCLLGPAIGAMPQDLAERTMLGDCGANALGALAGVIAVQAPPAVRYPALVGAVSLILISERVSFTKVIESTPVLRELDGLGRRPR